MRDLSLTVRLDLAVRVDLRLDRDPGLDPVDLEVRAAEPVDMVGLHRAVPGVPAGRVVLRPVGRVVLLDLVLTRRPALVLPVGRVVLDLAVPVVPDRQCPVRLVAPARQVGRAVLLDLADRVVPDLMAPVVPVVPVVPDPVVLGLMGRVSLAGPVGPVGPADRVGLVDPEDRAGLDRMDPAGPRRSRIGPEVSTIAAVPSLVAPPTRRTASVHPTMVRRLLPRSTGSAGTTGLLPEVRRPTGPGRRLRVAGTDLRLPVAGTDHGTDRRARSLWRRPILGHSITVASTPFQSSTRSSADGASGSSARGFRCTDITSTLATSGPWFARPEVAARRCT